MLNRRDFLFAAASTAALAPAAGALAQSSENAGLNGLYDQFFQQNLQLNPEGATELGLDRGANAALKSRLGDVSAAGIAEARRVNAERIAQLKSMSRPAGGMDRVNYDTVLYVEESTKPLYDLDIGGMDGFSPSPYVLSPITGAYARVPVFLDTKHTVETKADADAYLARLDAFAGVLDANTDRFRHDVAQGVIPPDFLIDITLSQVGQVSVPTAQSGLVSSLARRAAAKGLGDSYGKDAAGIYEQKVRPALERQIAALKEVRPKATHDAGVWRFEKGPAFYAANLRYTTTTNMTPDEVHQLGLDQAAEIGARLDVLLKKQGLTQGTVGERIQALYKDPKYYYPQHRRRPRRTDRVPAGPAQDGEGAAADHVRPPPQHADRGPPGAAGHRFRRARRLFRERADGPLAAGLYLLQPARHGRMAEVEPALHPLSRGAAGPSAAGRAGAGKPGHPDAAQEHVLLRLWRRLGAVRRAAGRRDGHV